MVQEGCCTSGVGHTSGQKRAIAGIQPKDVVVWGFLNSLNLAQTRGSCTLRCAWIPWRRAKEFNQTPVCFYDYSFAEDLWGLKYLSSSLHRFPYRDYFYLPRRVKHFQYILYFNALQMQIYATQMQLYSCSSNFCLCNTTICCISYQQDIFVQKRSQQQFPRSGVKRPECNSFWLAYIFPQSHLKTSCYIDVDWWRTGKPPVKIIVRAPSSVHT